MNSSNLTIERIFDVELEQVWRCWHDPNYIEKWYGSDPEGHVHSIDMDFRVGGLYRITFSDSDHAEHTSMGQHLVIDPYHTIQMTMEWTNEPGQVSMLNLDFIDLKGKTKMIFSQNGIPQSTIHNYGNGWRSTFDKIEKLLEELKKAE
ncbi:SRPBCC domain-containing protein [Algoriphagus sp. A40]|uniref:SRPBCC family protein n=1 Tax=Algoriphagus sp. A40 TaxID=1945863 RepID=UPI0009875D68|nr:SRPBCC domain-containing protein [Algoriphagus sp. A40]OOG71124.1 hypothetical protein B0E43_17550 [Algoriphagus sp. A40]